MTENFNEDRWNVFMNSGRVSDYLSYKGIGVKSISSLKGELSVADNNRGNGNICSGNEG